jgi:hypothetical protein
MVRKLLVIPILVFACQSSLFSQSCHDTLMPSSDFKAVVQTAHADVGWSREWIDFTGGLKCPGRLHR